MHSSSLHDRPLVLTCRTTADFLAALPRFVGYTTDDSIFIVLFSGSRSGQAMRLDLPPDESPEHVVPLLDFICSTLDELGVSTGSSPAVVITSSTDFSEAGGAPWRTLARDLENRLRSEGIQPRELCCLAPDGWVSFLDPEAPLGGRPLSEIAESPIALAAGVQGGAPPDLADLGAVPEPDPDRRDAVLAALETLTPYEPGGVAGGPSRRPPRVPARREAVAVLAEQHTHPAPLDDYAWLINTAEVAEALRDTERELTPAMTARLIRCAQVPDRWLVLALGVLTRPRFPVELAEEIGPAQFVRVPVDLDAGPEPSLTAGWSVLRVLANICPEFDDHARVPPLRDRLRGVLSETPRDLRPAVLAFSAWVWWLGGSQSVAQQQLELAFAIDPRDELSRMIARLVAVPPSLRPAQPLARRAA